DVEAVRVGILPGSALLKSDKQPAGYERDDPAVEGPVPISPGMHFAPGGRADMPHLVIVDVEMLLTLPAHRLAHCVWPSPDSCSWDVQWAQRVASTGTFWRQYGQSFSVGAFGASGFGRLSALTPFTMRKIQNAIIRKLMTVLTNWPYAMTGTPFATAAASDSGLLPSRAMNRSVKLAPPRIRPIGGIMTSLTSEVTIPPKAEPMTTPTARSMTLPRMANVLNSSIIFTGIRSF